MEKGSFGHSHLETNTFTKTFELRFSTNLIVGEMRGKRVSPRGVVKIEFSFVSLLFFHTSNTLNMIKNMNTSSLIVTLAIILLASNGSPRAAASAFSVPPAPPGSYSLSATLFF